MKELIAELIKDLNDIGIPLVNPEPLFRETYAEFSILPGGRKGGTSNSLHLSRLMSQSNVEDFKSDPFLNTMALTHSVVQGGGYSLHPVDYAPTYEAVGVPDSHSTVLGHLRHSVFLVLRLR
jgi:hypothetical protein